MKFYPVSIANTERPVRYSNLSVPTTTEHKSLFPSLRFSSVSFLVKKLQTPDNTKLCRHIFFACFSFSFFFRLSNHCVVVTPVNWQFSNPLRFFDRHLFSNHQVRRTNDSNHCTWTPSLGNFPFFYLAACIYHLLSLRLYTDLFTLKANAVCKYTAPS